jgi:hypothetical protein
MMNEGSFEAAGSQETVPDQHLEEPTISYLGVEALGPPETPITDFSAPIIVQIYPYEHQTLSHTAMETNAATYSRNYPIPTMVVTIGGVPPTNPPFPVQAIMVSTASTSSSGPIPSLATITAPFTQSATDPLFSYGMPSLCTSPVLSYSTLQTLGLGEGSSNTPLQGPMRGTSSPFNSFPYEGGHIPSSSPLLDGAHQQSAGPNAHHSSFGAGSQGPPSHNMPVGSTPFSLFGAFGNNAFSLASFLTGGNPGYRQPNPMQGTIPSQGAHPETSSTSGPWNSWQGLVPFSGMLIEGNSFHNQWNPGQGAIPIPMGSTWGNPSQSPSNVMHAQPSTSYFGNQPMMSPQTKNPYTGHGHGFYQNPGQQPNFSWQPGASQTRGPFFQGYHQQPKLPFLETLHFPDLTRLLNDPICHDLHCPPIPTKLPSDIQNFEAKPNEDPGDHVTTFHLWCSPNSLKDDSIQL